MVLECRCELLNSHEPTITLTTKQPKTLQTHNWADFIDTSIGGPGVPSPDQAQHQVASINQTVIILSFKNRYDAPEFLSASVNLQ